MDAVLAFLLLLNAILLIVFMSKGSSHDNNYNYINIKFKLKKIMATQQELAAQLTATAAQVAKVKTEVENLLAIIAGQANVSPELQAAADAVQAAVQGVDDLNADA
jgi:hypothetical protein